MTKEELMVLRQCKKGTRLRVLLHHPKSYAHTWWQIKENLDPIMKHGVIIRDGQDCKFSVNKGFTGNVLITGHQGWGNDAGVTLYNAKVKLWKDGEPEYAIRIVRS